MTAENKSAQKFRARLRSLMHDKRWNQSETARRLKNIRQVWDQPRVNRLLRGDQSPTLDDLDDIARLFVVLPADLLIDEYGQAERRKGGERRSGVERRQRQDQIWTPVERHHWPAAVKKKA
jgi:transcriptional regulator with XRE-family HTH domain